MNAPYIVQVWDKGGLYREESSLTWDEAVRRFKDWHDQFGGKVVALYNGDRMEDSTDLGPHDGLTEEERDALNE